MRPLLVLLLLLPVATAALPPPTAAHADFAWSPARFGAHDNVTFVSQSSSDSGAILAQRWRFPGDEELTLRLGESATYAFPTAGDHFVTLEIVDAYAQRASVTKLVTVANMPPVPSFEAAPSPAFRGVEVSFAGAATDRDGDAITSWRWELGDGAMALGRNATHSYAELGVYSVRLEVQDAAGNAAAIVQPLYVVNRPPEVSASFSPADPRPGESVTFAAAGIDHDSPGALSFRWTFSDGLEFETQNVTRVFSTAGNHTATVRAMDAEGALSAPLALHVLVD